MTTPGKDRNRAVLLVNLGTPEAPEPAAVRRYLAEFLWDPRVVEIPRPLWWLILHGVILRVRPRKSARAYGSIWTRAGSPLLVLSRGLAEAFRAELRARIDGDAVVEIAMRYGKPAISEQLEALRARGIERFLILPLYPQYSSSSTGSVFDAVASVFARWRYVPEVHFVSHYFDHPAYIAAVAESIRQFWREQGRSGYLLMSFHGLPERSRELGDPYYDQCHATACLIARRLDLQENAWRLVFQSRFGPARWLQPYCIDVLKDLPQRGVREVDVVCPGFAVDCLETLEEIGIANKKAFMEAGGARYRLIPALNDSVGHARALAEVVSTRSDFFCS
jgi:ferrochelatase